MKTRVYSFVISITSPPFYNRNKNHFRVDIFHTDDRICRYHESYFYFLFRCPRALVSRLIATQLSLIIDQRNMKRLNRAKFIKLYFFFVLLSSLSSLSLLLCKLFKQHFDYCLVSITINISLVSICKRNVRISLVIFISLLQIMLQTSCNRIRAEMFAEHFPDNATRGDILIGYCALPETKDIHAILDANQLICNVSA